MLSDIALAITEATTNVVLHAYRDRDEPGDGHDRGRARRRPRCLYVRDEGSGLAPRVDSPGLGLGLGLIAQVADSADVRAPETGGTEVVMRFNVARAPPRVSSPMQLVRSGPAGSAALELAISHALLTRVAAGELPSTLRVYRPAPAVAFGKLDTLRPGYAAAVEAARAHGYEPVLRLPGGHAAAYHRESLAHRRRLGARRPGRRHPRPLRDRGRAARGRAAHARRRRARGGGAGRVLPGRLQRQRARAGEADRHRPAARPRRGAARRVDRRRRRRRASAPCSTTSTPRSSSPGTPPPRAPSTRRSRAPRSTPSRPRSSPPTTSSSRPTLDEETLALAHRLEPLRSLRPLRGLTAFRLVRRPHGRDPAPST